MKKFWKIILIIIGTIFFIFIISYEFNEKSGIYSYTRSTKKRNDLPPEFL